MSKEDKPQEKPTEPEEDEELSSLLNSALKDFSKDRPDEKAKDESASSRGDEDPDRDAQWTEDFIRQTAEQFESNFANILQGSNGEQLTPDQVQESFQRMAEAAMQALSSPNDNVTSNAEFSSTISQTLQDLSQGAENVQSPFSEDQLRNMFSPQANTDDNAFLPFMQGMLKSLLSKDVLYPSLKDISDKFPGWLEANGGSLSAEQLRNYQQQAELMRNMCTILEAERESDSEEVKGDRYNRVFSLMQQLQDLGQPPTELVSDAGPGVRFDSLGNPDPGQCCVM